MSTNLLSLRQIEQSLSEVRASRRHADREHAFVGSAVRQRLEELHHTALASLAQTPASTPTLRTLVDVAQERRAIDEQDQRARVRADDAIAEALDRLRVLESSNEMSRNAPAELRSACGFTRVMISSAHGSRWMPDAMRPADHVDPDAAEFTRFAQDDNEIPLARLMPETEMVRNRVPVIVQDAESNSRAYKPLVQVTKSQSYVAAPIVTTRRVIGFFHADRVGQISEVTRGDLDSIALFASEFGVMFAHEGLADRWKMQRAELAAAFQSTIDGLDELSHSSVTREAAGADGRSLDRERQEKGRPNRTRGESLTGREREVVALIAAGATNRLIAQELVLSVDTVKTHIRNIMRKLHASSRSEAVVHYLQSRSHPAGST